MRKSMSAMAVSSEKGFTLVELLIVVIILAVLAAIVVPQFGSSTEDAKVSTVKTDLTAIRNAVELYYHQHNGRYPGKYGSTTATVDTATDAAGAATALVAQLTQYTDAKGVVSGTKDATYKYGPYIKGTTLPANPFLSGATATAVVCDVAIVDLTAAHDPSGTGGWKFFVGTGRFIANDNTALSDGTNTKTL